MMLASPYTWKVKANCYVWAYGAVKNSDVQFRPKPFDSIPIQIPPFNILAFNSIPIPIP